MDLFQQYLMSFVKTPYKYGGKSYYGIDCSGLVMKVFSTFGVYSGDDLSAQGIFDKYQYDARWNDYRPGGLVFFGKDVKNIEHVSILLTPNQMLEARGGDRTTLTYEDAKSRDALVEITHINHRKDRVALLRPAYPFDVA